MSATIATVLAAVPIPEHPTTQVKPAAEYLFTVFLGIPVFIGLFIAVRHLMTGKGPLLLYCLIGGGIACLFEPIVDVMGLAYMREGAKFTTFYSMGRDFPLYINFVYIWYVGGLAYLAYRIFSNGVTKKSLLALYVMDICINVFLESPGVLLGAYEYYGPQPLNFWGLPLWWVFVNPLMPLIAGALIYRLKPFLPGKKLALVIAFIPMADGMGNGAAAWPMWTALNWDASLWVTYGAWLVTVGLALTVIWVLSFVVARPEEEVTITTKMGMVKAAIFGVPEGDVPPRPLTIPGQPAAQPGVTEPQRPAPQRQPAPVSATNPAP